MSDFDRWQERFAGEDYLFGTAPNAFVAREAGRIAPGSEVLCIADGEGRNGVWLAEQKHRVLSQDFSPNAQAKARALTVARGVSLAFELSDLTARDWAPERYDAVVGIFFQFLTPAERPGVFAGMIRTLKPGGVLLIEGYRPEQLAYATGGPKAVENLYTEPMLREAFRGLAEIDIRTYDAEVDEGAGHSGMSALIDLVGRT